jgi:CheY-like chemotaxis protein
VLVAEDNPINQLLAREMVQRAGFDCDCVGTGHEAVVAASTGAYATILMDCMMPELDGFEATRLIREDESLHPSIGHVPIIALTARAMAGDREECLAAGMDDYLSKPFAPDDVANMLRRWTRAPGV